MQTVMLFISLYVQQEVVIIIATDPQPLNTFFGCELTLFNYYHCECCYLLVRLTQCTAQYKGVESFSKTEL